MVLTIRRHFCILILEKLWWKDLKQLQGTEKVTIIAGLEEKKEGQHMNINMYTTAVEVRNS